MKIKFNYSWIIVFALLAPYFTVKAQTCSFSLGNDTSICQGVPFNFNLTTPSGATAYLWDNGTTLATRQVNAYGTYYCKLTKNGTNLVTNGDFNLGNTGFTSGYVVGTGGPFGLLSNPGTYLVTTNTSLAHSNFTSFNNHTAGGGKMLVVNGASTPNVSVWCQNISVTPNTDFNFSTWVTSCESGQPVSQLAILQFSINGTPLFLNGSTTQNTFSPTAIAPGWVQFAATWNSGSSTNASICIVNQNTSAAGNDFALDDIFFQPICVFTDTIHINPKPDPAGYNAGFDVHICTGMNAVLNANNGNGNSFSWTSIPPGFSSSSLNNLVSPTDTTKYVLFSDLNGCKKSDTAIVYVITMPAPSAGLNDTVCDGRTITLNGNAGGGSVFSWSSIPPGFVSSLVSPTVSPLLTTEYILTSVNQICIASDTVQIVVNTSPIADFTMLPADSSCNSYALSFINNSINSTSSFWEFGDGEFSTDPFPLHTYQSQNIFQVKLTAKNSGCKDTRLVSLKIAFSENSLFVPNSFTPNNDLRNDSFFIPKGCLDSVALVIYDRWGQLVAHWNNTERFWDGKINGSAAPAGVYIYVLEGYFLSGERTRKKGTITLFR